MMTQSPIKCGSMLNTFNCKSLAYFLYMMSMIHHHTKVVVGVGLLMRFELLLLQFDKVLLCDTQVKQVWMLHRLTASRYFLDSFVEKRKQARAPKSNSKLLSSTSLGSSLSSASVCFFFHVTRQLASHNMASCVLTHFPKMLF